jgi:hypothetical protein
MTVAGFMENKYKTLILPVRKPTKRRGYEVVLRKHVLPEFAGSQLAEVTRERGQFFINRKARSVAWKYGEEYSHGVERHFRGDSDVWVFQVESRSIYRLATRTSEITTCASERRTTGASA